jgi:hypothetical protein
MGQKAPNNSVCPTLPTSLGTRGVAGSNPVTPTSFPDNRSRHGERYGGRNTAKTVRICGGA